MPPSPEVLLIRADGSTAIGTGHVMRCLALAQAWTRTGGRAVFALARSTPALLARLASEGFATLAFSAAPGDAADAAHTLAHARALPADWIVADGYGFGAPWQKQIKDAGFRLLVLDDYGHAAHTHADLLLNQNASADEALYARRDASTRLLLGTRHALLRREFLAARDTPRAFPAEATKILVTLGGSDPDNVTALALAALARLPRVEARVVAGGSNPHLPALRAAVAPLVPAIQLVENTSDMPALMAWADVAFSAAGSTSWELACLGLPAVLAVLADNQAGIAAALAREGAAVNLGDHRTLTAEKIAAALESLLADEPRRRELAGRSRRLVDGHGASRVVAALRGKLAVTLVSDADSWLNAFLPALRAELEAAGHRVRWIHDPAALETGDLAFFLSLGRIVPPAALRCHAHNLVVHESALPHGRGWSPLTWQVLEGKTEIPVTLLEAGEAVDSGEIYARDTILLDGHELVADLRSAQAAATFRLCRDFVSRYPFCLADARPQTGAPTYYARRRPADSRLDPDKTIREQLNLLRVSDPARYPAFFEIDGRRYQLHLHAAAPSPS